jgi:ankyrin repeat protein
MSIDDFARAVRHEDMETVARFCSSGFDVNIRENHRHPSLLEIAVHRYNLPMMKLLLDNHADPNERHSWGYNSLLGYTCHSISIDTVKVVQMLLEYKADPNKAIQVVCRHKPSFGVQAVRKQIVKLLLDYKASPTSCYRHTKWKMCLIHQATLSYNLGMINCLVDAKADINQEDNEGRTALCYAIHDNNLGSAAVLLQRGAHLTELRPEWYSNSKETIAYIQHLVQERVAMRLPTVLAQIVAEYII